MAALTSTGINFSDGTSLNSKYGIVPKDSVSIFFQLGAPTGWSKLTTHNDKTLRVVAGTGGGFGGGSAFTTVFPGSLTTISTANVPMTGSVGSHTLSEPQLPSHTHGSNGSVGLSPGGGDVQSGGGWTRIYPATSPGPSVGGGGHNHPWSGTAQFSTSVDLRVQYIDVILCQFS